MDWTHAYFGADYPRLYPAHLDAARSAREALAAAQILGVRPPARLLDAGCGFGRHAVPLAEAGFEVVGVDWADPLLTRARHAASAAGVGARCRLLNLDFTALRPADLGGPVDGALSLFASLGYGDEAADDRLLAGLFACLVPGGRMVLDLNNHARVASLDGVRTWAEHQAGDDRWFVLEAYRFDRVTRRLEGERVLVDPGGGEVKRFPFSFRSYTPGEVRAKVHDAGLRVLSLFGGFDRSPFDASSARLVVLAERP